MPIAPRPCRRDAPPAPDRPGDLHPLQHVRGDVPGRRDHARLAQLRRRSRDVQRVQRVHLAVPDRRDRQLARRSPRASAYTIDGAARVGRAARAAGRRGGGGAGASRRTSRAITADATRRPGRRRPPPPWSAAHPYVNLYTLAKPAVATVTGNFRADRRRRVERHPPHRARLRRDAVSRARGPDDRHRAAGRRRAGPPASRAPVLGREPARRRAPALQQRRAHREARDRGPRGHTRCAASRRTTCATSRRARPCSVVGPFGTSFLMPNHPGANLLMICTGTGSAPMRAMTERRRRRIALQGRAAS